MKHKMEIFDEEFHEDNPELSQPIALCEACGEYIYDNSNDMYVDEDNNYFCCLDCAMRYYGIHQPDDTLC